jgi:hypothetical protein
MGGGNEMDMGFFVTSRGSRRGGGDFRQQVADQDGLAGADALCQELAAAGSAAVGNRMWRAYLSTDRENARDRIGKGPWRNARGAIIANDVDELHEGRGMMNRIAAGNMTNALDERGQAIDFAHHDILTGSDDTGRVDRQGRTCNNWRSSAAQLQAIVGHSDRRSNTNGIAGQSWNASHAVSCGDIPANGNNNRVPNTVSENGGRGAIFCFAAD